MCTVSWIHQGPGYQLFCNRDEKHTRRPASKPQLLTRGGVRFLAPIDGDFGGTWIAVCAKLIVSAKPNGIRKKTSRNSSGGAMISQRRCRLR